MYRVSRRHLPSLLRDMSLVYRVTDRFKDVYSRQEEGSLEKRRMTPPLVGLTSYLNLIKFKKFSYHSRVYTKQVKKVYIISVVSVPGP